jgi:hypothetical protein
MNLGLSLALTRLARTGGGAPLDNWILQTGFWNDGGSWSDTKLWND